MGMINSEILYERFYKFARDCQSLSKILTKTNYNLIYIDQLIRASGSIGANYIEALEALSKKDFLHRLKISRKEAREAIHWLRLIKDSNSELKVVVDEAIRLINEAQEIKKILSASIITLEKNNK